MLGFLSKMTGYTFYILTADVFEKIEGPKEIKYSTWTRVGITTIDVYSAST